MESPKPAVRNLALVILSACQNLLAETRARELGSSLHAPSIADPFSGSQPTTLRNLAAFVPAAMSYITPDR